VLLNLLASNMPNSYIVTQPGSGLTYRDDGTGYQEWFLLGAFESSSGANMAQVLQSQNGTVNAEWWRRYAVAVLTDAIRQVLGFALDTGKLTGDLGNFNSTFLPCLAASCFAVYQNGFTPTANALAAIAGAGQTQDACAALEKLISSQQFITNVNEAIATGGDNAPAVVWFLFFLWITLKALGLSDVDAAISGFASAGLSIPPQIGPKSWWNGGYTSWYPALSGSDLAGSPWRERITATMAEELTGPTGTTVAVPTPNGYSQSLCYWGDLKWYNPPPSSCFGAGTGVLMADGSVRPIEDVQIGGAVRTDLGTARVLLVESPLRAAGPLYRINHLDVYATAGHPFRLAPDSGAAHCANDPWTLVDTVPTMVFDGVDGLVPGTRLAGLGRGRPQVITVGDIERMEPEATDSSRVYDLILERAAGKIAFYYVGGPTSFLAVDAKTSDGSREPMATVAIVKAMETAIESCRRANPGDAVLRLGEPISHIDVSDAVRRTRASAWGAADQPQAQLSMPARDFFLQDGRWLLQGGNWDSRASLLGTHLVRRFGRMVRREAATGWRLSYSRGGNGDYLTLVLHDLIFVDMGGKISGDPLEIEFRLRGPGGEDDAVRTLTVAASASADARIAHSIVDFGPVPSNTRPAALIGAITQNGRPVGVFRADVLAQAAHGALECFLFAPEGNVVGLVALEPRVGSEADFLREQEQAKSWTDRHAFALAQSLGQEIGAQLAAEFDKAGPAAMEPSSP
jgi:hypothetical protein